MKRLLLSVPLLLWACSAVFSQRIMKVEKKDGTTIDYLVRDIKQVYFEGEDTEPADLAISHNALSMTVGETLNVEITAGSDHYSVVSEMPSVATATLNGKTITVHAETAGTTSIIITDTQSGKTAKIDVTVTNADSPIVHHSCPDSHHPHLIDLGIGTKWACCNLGATAPEQYGSYYAWGETQSKNDYSWDTYQYGYANDENDDSQMVNIGADISGTQYDAATANWSAPWCMPSIEDCIALINNCTSEWTTLNGVFGRQFTGPNGGTIFMPATGLRWGTTLMTDGTNGYYWMSTQNEGNQIFARGLYFTPESADWDLNFPRSIGSCVRPVCKN